MKTQKILSLILVLLLLTSVSVPAASAQCGPAVVVFNPGTAKLVFDGIAVAVAGGVLAEIGNHLGKSWDGVAENFDNFVSGVGSALNDLFAAKKWVGITTSEGQAVMKAVYEYYTATSGDGGKKDDKWYFEARLNHGKIEINTERMDENQAVKEMGRGKNIMTLTEELAQNLVGRFKGLTEKATKELEFEGDHNPASGYFQHLHYEAKGMQHLHCWSWK